MLKSTAGGDEIGMRVCHDEPGLPDAFSAVQRLSEAHFGQGGIYLERFLPRARQLMSVRLAEKGVRMVQLYCSKGTPWDAHADIFAHKVNAKNSDQAFAAVRRFGESAAWAVR